MFLGIGVCSCNKAYEAAAESAAGSTPAAGLEIPSKAAGLEIPSKLADPRDEDDGSGPQRSDFECGPRVYPGRIFVLKFQLRPFMPPAKPR